MCSERYFKLPGKYYELAFSTSTHPAFSERQVSPRRQRSISSAAMRPKLFSPWEREVTGTGQRSLRGLLSKLTTATSSGASTRHTGE